MSREDYRIIEAHLNFLRAIQLQADKDGLTGDFEAYWFHSPEMVEIWQTICVEGSILIDGIVNECVKSDE